MQNSFKISPSFLEHSKLTILVYLQGLEAKKNNMQKEAGKVASKKAFKTALFIFRRDLRLDDNTGLLKALSLAEEVYPVFIFDPRQIHQSRNDYFSNNCV